MRLQVVGSSSEGNCYILTDSAGKSLIVEAGCPLSQVKKALRFDISGIDACIVSHEHGDHSKFVGDFLRCGIRVLALPEVFKEWGINNTSFCKAIEPGQGFVVGEWKIITLSVAHDVPCLAFIIAHREMGKTLFVTDTMMLEYRVNGVNHMMLECNYADDILERNIDNGIIPAAMRKRLLNSHMEIETTKQIIRANATDKLQDIVLIHLSSNNSDAARFQKEIEAVSGVPTYIADKGTDINPFNLIYYS